MKNELIRIQPEVAMALKQQQPVVALESTIISHGMPWPQNVETALAVEKVVRDNGAVPATIAILDGKAHIGLTKDQLEFFGKEQHVMKVSLRDIPLAISKKLYGATTVAATMRLASIAGIKIFVTGGIGGVHRGAASSMDISADLTEMGHTSVTVISAGVKSILDIGLTLEYLETLGIPVITYGQDAFPSFYSSQSGFISPMRLDSAAEIASLMRHKWEMGIEGAVLVANPVPVNQEVSKDEMEVHIRQALEAAEQKQVAGKEVTPFLLKYIADHTKGESLATNIALILNNAKLGAEIAVAYENYEL